MSGIYGQTVDLYRIRGLVDEMMMTGHQSEVFAVVLADYCEVIWLRAHCWLDLRD